MVSEDIPIARATDGALRIAYPVSDRGAFEEIWRVDPLALEVRWPDSAPAPTFTRI
jgi:hypothetical protein